LKICIRSELTSGNFNEDEKENTSIFYMTSLGILDNNLQQRVSYIYIQVEEKLLV